MNTKAQKNKLPIFKDNDVIIFHPDGTYTLNGVHSEVIEFQEHNKVPANVVEKAIEDGDFSSLIDNKFLSVDSVQVKSLLLNVFNQIKRNNPGLKEFSFSILTLFAGVVEIWDLTQDRDKYKKFEKDLLPRKLSLVELEIGTTRNNKETKKKLLDIYKKRNAKLVSDFEMYVDYEPITEDKRKEQDKLIDGYTFYLNSVANQKANIAKLSEKLENLKTKRDSITASTEFKHYSLSDNGNLYTTMQTNLIGKYEKITKLMEQFNITPNSMKLDGGEIREGRLASSGFSKFSSFEADKKKAIPN